MTGTSGTTGTTTLTATDAAGRVAPQPDPQHGSPITLPTGTLVLWVVLATLLVAGGWAGVVSLGAHSGEVFLSGMLGAGLVGLIAVAGVFVMTPWRQRLVIDWMPMWLASTVFRMLVTPVLAFVLYSAASSILAVKPLGIAVALTYLATLFVEATVLSQYLNRSCPLPSSAAAGSSKP